MARQETAPDSGCPGFYPPGQTDSGRLPSEERSVILKQLPVLQCGACIEYLIEEAVTARIDTTRKNTDCMAELEVLRYAA